MRISALAAVTIFSALLCSALDAQTISYMTPDIGAPGMNVYVEVVGPYDEDGNFGSDGWYMNNAPDAVRLECANPADTGKITIGPLVVSWNGKLISSQIFIHTDVAPNSSDWNVVASEFRIPLRVVRNGNMSNTVMFTLVRPQPAIMMTTSGTIGSGGVWGLRSPRGAMIVDSLHLEGDSYSISLVDTDGSMPGNQAYLPAVILSRGVIRTGANTTLHVNASGKHGGPGGAGGGGNFCDFTGSGSDGGDGFTGGGRGGRNRAGNPIGSDEYRNPGVGSGPFIGVTGGSLNGVPGGNAPAYEASSGGTGHPFGLSGEGCNDGGNCSPAGGFGGGSGQQQRINGGGGGYATPGNSSRDANGGQVHGNDALVPFAGGSGGAGGNPQQAFACSGDGGGGGGALRLYGRELLVQLVTAHGGDGSDGQSADGGAGSGGAVSLEAKLLSSVWKSGALGGFGPSPGGAGRLRFDGPVMWTSSAIPVDESMFYGPSTDTSRYVTRSFTLTGTGGGDSIDLYLKADFMPWTKIGTVGGYTTSWSFDITLPSREAEYYVVAAQRIPVPSSDRYAAEPVAILAQAAANILLFKPVPEINAASRRDLPELLCEADVRDTTFVRNVGDGSLTVSAIDFFNGTQGFTLLEPAVFPVVVPPGDSLRVIAHFAPPAGAPGQYRDTLRVFSDDVPRSPWNIAYQARAQHAEMTVEFTTLQFDTLLFCEGSEKVLELRVSNSGTVPVLLQLPVLGGAGFELRDPPPVSFPLLLPAGASTLFRVAFVPPGSGVYSGTLDVRSGEESCSLQERIALEGVAASPAADLTARLLFESLRCPGQVADSVLLLRNTGDTPMRLQSLRLLEGAAFTILDPVPPLPVLLPGQSLPVRVRFDALSVGVYEDTLEASFSSCSLVLRASLFGAKDSTRLEGAAVDFALVGATEFPVEQTVTVRNTGSQAVLLSSSQPTPGLPFTIVAGLPVTLQPGGAATLTVRFDDPGSDGSYSDRIALLHGPGCDSVFVAASGTRGTASLTLAIDTLSVEVGTEFDLRVRLLDRVNVALLGANRIRTTLRFNRAAFFPLVQDLPVFDGNDRLLTVTVPLTVDGDDVALRIRCVATLGDVVTTAITTENTEAINGSLEITEFPGRLTLLGICREGGTRLIGGTAPVQLQQNSPNPFNPVTEIEFTVIEHADTELLVFDRLGREVASLLRERLEPGTYRALFDAGALPSGVYFSVLRTPTYTASRKMLLMK